ncbi:hypothetical protein ILYODFUR_004702 [Ilyodon furcidens]|uniref:Uncharacterized protein n=1 Tax=Ilyodon furcidens TaxID=33524 RepID=A0ABV0T5L3_9TELE
MTVAQWEEYSSCNPKVESSNFLLLHADMPLSKALNIKLPTDLHVSATDQPAQQGNGPTISAEPTNQPTSPARQPTLTTSRTN